MKKMNRKIGILGLTLVLLMMAMPLVSADASTNEAIDSLSVSFTGTGNSTQILITVGLNSVAQDDGGLIIKFWIDEKTPANVLGQTAAGGSEWDTVWDITKWDEGYHVLIAELFNPSIEVANDNKADNRLDLPFTTQGWFWAFIGDIYGYIEYNVNRILRQEAGGTFSWFAGYALWMWIIAIIILVVIITLILRRRKRQKYNQPRDPYQPIRYARDRFGGF